MLYRDSIGTQTVIQNSKLGYAFFVFKAYQPLSISLDKTDLGYFPIGPTILVEWEE